MAEWNIRIRGVNADEATVEVIAERQASGEVQWNSPSFVINVDLDAPGTSINAAESKIKGAWLIEKEAREKRAVLTTQMLTNGAATLKSRLDAWDEV